MTYICIGVPYWIGERQNNSAVDAVKAAALAAELGVAWVDIQPNFAAHDNPVVAVNRALADAIQAHADKIPLIFAADCVSALGAMKGLETKQPAVLWYDAHGDFNTWATTPSGFLGGMPLAALVGRDNDALMQGVGTPIVAEREVIVTDARDLDLQEGANLAQSAITHLKSVNDLLAIALPDKPLYVHFDTDVVTDSEMPAMNYPTTGGPTLAETQATLERVARDAEVAGVLFSLWNHDKPGANIALTHTLQLVRAFVQANGLQANG